jgi:hypothetical protein
MTFGTAIFLIAVGAILRWAVNITWESSHVNWHLVGDILMVIGVIGLILSLIWMLGARRRTTTIDRPDVPPYA